MDKINQTKTGRKGNPQRDGLHKGAVLQPPGPGHAARWSRSSTKPGQFHPNETHPHCGHTFGLSKLHSTSPNARTNSTMLDPTHPLQRHLSTSKHNVNAPNAIHGMTRIPTRGGNHSNHPSAAASNSKTLEHSTAHLPHVAV